MANRVILVPRRADNGHRDRLWLFCKEYWSGLGYPIYEGDHLEGPFNRSAGVNLAARLAGDWDTALVIDADVIVDLHNVEQGIVLAEHTGRQVFPFRDYRALNNAGALKVMEGFKGGWMPYVKQTFRDNRSACFAIPRTCWDRIGGFDERFVGWGYEDVAFSYATSAAAGNYLRLSGDLWHLWHPKNPENNHQSKLYLANRDLCSRYIEAMYSWEDMHTLLAEPGGPLA